jgi:hypothetical protein
MDTSIKATPCVREGLGGRRAQTPTGSRTRMWGSKIDGHFGLLCHSRITLSSCERETTQRDGHD